MKNGRYPENSYGKGRTHSFVDMALKAGLTYKFNGRHFLTANVSYGTEAPLPNNAYLSPRISDMTPEDVENGQKLESGRVFSADVNYIFHCLPSRDVFRFIRLISTIRWSVAVTSTEPTSLIMCYMV